MSTMTVSRRLKVLALPVLVALFVAACGSQAPTSGTTTDAPAAPAAQEARSIRIYGVGGPPVGPVIDMLVEGFKAKHPDVEVKLETAPTGDYAEQIYAMAAANNLPDVMFTADIFTAPFVDAGVLLDMEPYAKQDSEFKLDDIYESILGLGRVEGTPGLYMIPASLDTVQMYYNKSMWEAAGAPLPEANWTWDQLIESCKQIQAANAEVKCLSVGNAGRPTFEWWAYWVPWVRGYGGDVLSEDGKTSTLDTPEALAGIQAYADLWAKHDIATPLGTDAGGDCFVNQRCAAVFFIPGVIKGFQESIGDSFEWDVQLAPAHPEGQFTGMGTFGFTISNSTKHPDAAWDFVKYLASPEGQRTVTREQIGVPLLKSLANDPVLSQLKAPPANIQAFIKGGDIGIFPRTYPVRCGSLYSGQINSLIKNGLEQVIRGAGTAADVFPGINQEIQGCLDAS